MRAAAGCALCRFGAEATGAPAAAGTAAATVAGLQQLLLLLLLLLGSSQGCCALQIRLGNVGGVASLARSLAAVTLHRGDGRDAAQGRQHWGLQWGESHGPFLWPQSVVPV